MLPWPQWWRKTLEINPDHPVINSNRSKLSKLLRFPIAKSEVSLDKYLDRMQESQESIYYISGDSSFTMKKALHIFPKKDLDGLMLADRLDEPCSQKFSVTIQEAEVRLDETEEKRFAKIKDLIKPLTERWKEKLTNLTEEGAMEDAGMKVAKAEKQVEAEREDDDGRDVETGDEREKTKKNNPLRKPSLEQVNTQKAVWLREEDVTEEKYTELYESSSGDCPDPLAHFNASSSNEKGSIWRDGLDGKK